MIRAVRDKARKVLEDAGEPVTASDDVRDAIMALVVDGKVTPDAVVDAAAIPDSPLHKYFEWDDKVAAHSFRIERARHLIRSIRIEHTVEEHVVTSVAFAHDPQAEDGERRYALVEEIRKDPEQAQALIEVEFARVAAILRRAQNLADVVGVRAPVDSILRRIESLRRSWAPTGQAPTR